MTHDRFGFFFWGGGGGPHVPMSPFGNAAWDISVTKKFSCPLSAPGNNPNNVVCFVRNGKKERSDKTD